MALPIGRCVLSRCLSNVQTVFLQKNNQFHIARVLEAKKRRKKVPPLNTHEHVENKGASQDSSMTVEKKGPSPLSLGMAEKRKRSEEDRKNLETLKDSKTIKDRLPKSMGKGQGSLTKTFEKEAQSYGQYLAKCLRTALHNTVLIKVEKHRDKQYILKILDRKYEIMNCFRIDVQNPAQGSGEVFLVEVRNERANRMAVISDDTLLKLDRRDKSWNDTSECPVKIQGSTSTFQLDTLSRCTNLTEQIKLLYNSVKITEGMVKYQFFITGLFKRAANKIFNEEVDVTCFGSGASGTALNGSSDLDLSFFYAGKMSERSILNIINKEIGKTSVGILTGKLVLPHAKVPIVKLEERLLKLSVDVSLNNLSGYQMAEALYLLNLIDNRLYPLIVTLKYWARENNVYVWPSFTNHMLTMLLIAFLQGKAVLPPFCDLYREGFEFSEDERVRFKAVSELQRESARKQKGYSLTDLGTLLIEFFKFYSEFDFRDVVIDIHSGQIIAEKHFYDVYVVDPHKQSNNVCRNFKAVLVARFKKACEQTYNLLKSSQDKTKCQAKTGNENGHWGLQCVLPLPNRPEKEFASKEYMFNSIYGDANGEEDAVILTATDDGEEIVITDERKNLRK